MSKQTYKVSGMHCVSCATMIELDLEDAGIKAKCSYTKETLEIEGSPEKNKIIEIVKKSGYSIK